MDIDWDISVIDNLFSVNNNPLDDCQNEEPLSLEEIYNILQKNDPSFKAIAGGVTSSECTDNKTVSIPRMTETVPQGIASVPQVSEGIPQRTENVSQCTESVTLGTENVPQWPDSVLYGVKGVPRWTVCVPKGTECLPQGTERVQQVAEEVPLATESVPQKTERLAQAAEGVTLENEYVPQGPKSVPQWTKGVLSKSEGLPQGTDKVTQIAEGIPQGTKNVPDENEIVPQRVERVLHLNEPYLEIIVQPAFIRFRYDSECKNRSAGSIPGVNNMLGKTFTTVKLHNCTGTVTIIASLVTKDKPYRAHPHKLVGNDCNEDGVCIIQKTIEGTYYEHQFKSLGIKFVKQTDIVQSLTRREILRIDPFNNKFDHKKIPKSIEQNAVRLCFQAFMMEEGRCKLALRPVVSNVILNKKAVEVLHISRTSHCSGTVLGGTEIIILCGKISKDDIEVVFRSSIQKKNEVPIWEALAKKIHVHNNSAIVFRTPAYLYPKTTENVTVYFQLLRPSDDTRSTNCMEFEYIPEFEDMAIKKRKVLSSSFLQTLSTSTTGFDNLAVPGPSHISMRRIEKRLDAVQLDEDSMSTDST